MLDPISTTLAVSLLSASVQGSTRMPSWNLRPNIAEETAPVTNRLVKDSGQSIYKRPPLILKQDRPLPTDDRWSLIKRLEAWSTLSDGWDGERSKTPAPEAIQLATHLIDLLPSDRPLPKPMMSSEGVIGLYWDLADRYVDVEIEQGHYSVYYRLKNTAEEHFLEGLTLEAPSVEQLASALGSQFGCAQEAA